MPDPGLKQEIAGQNAEAFSAAEGRNVIGSVRNKNLPDTIASPNGVIPASPAPSTVYKYPLDGEADFPARMRFTIKQVQAYTVDTTELKEYWDAPLLKKGWNRLTQSSKKEEILGDAYGLSDEERNAGAGRGAARPIDLPRDGGNPGGLQEAVKFKQAEASAQSTFTPDGAAGVKTKTVDNSPIISLYMPPALVINDDISYNQVDLGPGGLTAVAGINAGRSLLGAVGSAVSEGLESIFNLASGQISGTAAQVAAARMSNKIPSVGLRAAAATALQTGVNPGTRVLFDRPNIRQFTFQFRFIPTSAAEAAQVEKIIRIFREEMYPEELSVINNVPAGYRFPNLFEVDFTFLNSKAKFPRMQLSYLRSCQVSYNGSNMAFHADGHPTEIDMTLIFQEYRALAKQDIQKGY